MNFEKGKKNSPCGNLVIYCQVIGENPIEIGSEIIASNILVSFLTNKANMPAITFPPVAFKNKIELNNQLKKIQIFDLIKVEDFILPNDMSKAQDYINSRLEEVNKIVKEYVSLCISKETENKNDEPDETSSILERIDYMQKLTKQIDATLINGDEKQKTTLLNKATKYFDNFSKQNPQYPINNIINYIINPADNKLVNLLFKQSKAIYHENYEEAGNLQTLISKLKND